jgi:RNA recognition motif-containing protein
MPPRKRSRTTTKATKVSKDSTNGTKKQHIEASHTIFVSNLNSHIKSNKMKENLYILFSSFADIIQINYPRKNLRGQGWIVVSSPEDAIKCVTKLNGFQIFDQEINVQFARKEATIIETLSKLDILENIENKE